MIENRGLWANQSPRNEIRNFLQTLTSDVFEKKGFSPVVQKVTRLIATDDLEGIEANEFLTLLTSAGRHFRVISPPPTPNL